MSDNPSQPNLAFIGIVLMGSRTATRLLSAGYPVVAYNRSPKKCQPLGDLGARVAIAA